MARRKSRSVVANPIPPFGLMPPGRTAQELEHHWQIQTVPDLRRIISAEMGVPRDSWRIEYGDELHDKYRSALFSSLEHDSPGRLQCASAL